ncbi:MAG TPA: hypothetical protein VMT34_05240, partial [Aggregatilineales bacterium]|nr:hypothetical protein [Aggregatilineales bacterium]
MRVLMITQKVDPGDPLLAFAIGWIRALAARVDRLDVLCLEKQPAELPSNVQIWSMGKERQAGRLAELGTFYRVVNRVIRQTDVVFCHMVARYALLALPIVRLHRRRIGLWYTHPSAGVELRLTAPRLDWIATADSSSFPLHGANVHALGHGIDTTLYSPDSTPKADPPLIASVGRLSPIKDHDISLRAAHILKTQRGAPTCQFVVAGGEVPNAPGHREFLLQTRADLGLQDDYFRFAGALP